MVPRGEWYYELGGRACGPVSADEMAGLAAGGTVRSFTLVWAAGAAGWQPAVGILPKLFETGGPAPHRRPAPGWQKAVAGGLAVLALLSVAAVGAVLLKNRLTRSAAGQPVATRSHTA